VVIARRGKEARGENVDGPLGLKAAAKTPPVEIDPLAKASQSFGIDRLQPDEYDPQPQFAPEAEDVEVAQRDVTAGHQIILLAHAAAEHSFADRESMLGLHQRDIVDDEDPPLQVDDQHRVARVAAATSSRPGGSSVRKPAYTSGRLDEPRVIA
jgi:hypothetical protein